MLPNAIQQSPACGAALYMAGDYEVLQSDNGQVTWLATGFYDPITVDAQEGSFPPRKPSLRMLLGPGGEF